MVSLSNLRPGASNDDVRTVQQALIDQGHAIPSGPTGFFGEQTRTAYREEQLALGYAETEPDGIPGYASLSALGATGTT